MKTKRVFFPWPMLPCLCCPLSHWGVERLSANVLTDFCVLLRKTKSYISHILLCRDKYTAKGGWNTWYEHAEGFCTPSTGCLLCVTVPAFQITCASQLHPGRVKYPPGRSILLPPGSSLPFPALWRASSQPSPDTSLNQTLTHHWIPQALLRVSWKVDAARGAPWAVCGTSRKAERWGTGFAQRLCHY